MSDTIIVTSDGTTLQVVSTPAAVVEVIQPVTSIVEVAAAGPQGPPGPSGGSTIGGHPVVVTSAQNGDLLGFNGTSWYNRADTDVTDGGNF